MSVGAVIPPPPPPDVEEKSIQATSAPEIVTD
jgi:hypothetical protein